LEELELYLKKNKNNIILFLNKKGNKIDIFMHQLLNFTNYKDRIKKITLKKGENYANVTKW